MDKKEKRGGRSRPEPFGDQKATSRFGSSSRSLYRRGSRKQV